MSARWTIGRRLAAACLALAAACLALAAGAGSASAAPPVALTLGASAVTPTGATLEGAVTSESVLLDCHFEYVSVPAYRAAGFTDLSSGGSAPCSPAAASIPGDGLEHAVSATVSRPTPESLVYRLLASNGEGQRSGHLESIGFGLTDWDGAAFENSEPLDYNEQAAYHEPAEADTQAGSHPQIGSTTFSLTTEVTAAGQELPSEFLKDATAELPPGLIGNLQAVASCPIAKLHEYGDNNDGCPFDSQIGNAWFRQSDFDVRHLIGGLPSRLNETLGKAVPLYNMVPPPGVAALLGFQIVNVPTFIVAKLRTGGDYGATLSSLDVNETLPFNKFTFEAWGVPADPFHDELRGSCLAWLTASGRCPAPDAADPKSFLTLPTSCTGPVRTELSVRGWGSGEDQASFLSRRTEAEGGEPVGNTGCGELQFDPSLQARPTTNVADSPSGLDFDLHIPQASIHCDPGPPIECPNATAHLKDTTIALPAGLAVNPASANGLGACSSAQAGLRTPIGAKPIHFSEAGANCPEDAKIGTLAVDTPLLDHPAKGSVYLATPHDNPFDSLLAIYIAIDDPESGTHATLAGEVHADPATGQLTTTVSENPQLPVEDVKIAIPGGAYAPLRTPPTCGTYTTTSSLTPWSAPESGPPATPSDTYQISQGPGGGCATSDAQLPNSPSFDAGTVEPLAGHYSPFVLNLRREDGSQRFSAIGLQPPPGLLAKLAGTTRCSDAALAQAAQKSGQEEKANPSCPASSHVGEVVAGAGAGPAPYYAQGEAYLAGPYKGAPLSLAVIAPATAGPFDLGTIVLRTALHIDPLSARIDAVSDPIPAILQGIPLDIRTVQVRLDRPEFTLNPTSCDPTEVRGTETSTLGQIASLQSRFQLAECTRLGFKPKLTLSLQGGHKRGGHPALTAILKPRPGDANIGSISVALPHSEFLDQAHIGTICTRVQWAADACPAAAVYGTVSVTTPLLDQPLSGNVYLRSSDNPLPDLVPDLRGPADLPIRFEAAGRTDSIHGGIRNSFAFVPDAPFTKLVVRLKGGNKGLLVNSTDLCLKPNRATVRYGAHNGLARSEHPPLQSACKKPRNHNHTKRPGRPAHRRHRG